MIPDDLQAICVLPYNEDIAPLYPPATIATAVERILSNRAQEGDEQLVETWIVEQRGLQQRAEAVIEKMEAALVDPATEGLPSWILDKWAFDIKCPWSENLAEAVTQGETVLG